MKNYRKVHDFYFEDDEFDIISRIFPEYFIDQHLESDGVNQEFALRFLQNGLNSVLNSFLNSGYSAKGFLMYPLVRDISKSNIHSLIRLEKVADFLSKNGFDFSESLKVNTARLNSRKSAMLLSALHKDLSLIKNKQTKAIRKSKCSEFGLKGCKKEDIDYLKPLQELKYYAEKNLRKYLAGFYLHGSLATQDYVRGWSDADTLSIVSKQAIDNAESLLELRKKMYSMRYFFYKIDPLQHHGSIVISEYDLDNYCQTYFPVPIFRYAKSFFKDDRISQFKARSFEDEAYAKLFWFVNYFRNLKIKKSYRLGSYGMKALLHSVTLFPSLYLQAKSTLVYKKFSFGIAKKDFEKKNMGSY